MSRDLVTGLCLNSTASPDPVYEPCISGKQHRIVNKTATHSTVPLAIVHCDLHDPMPVAALDGSRYWMLVVDDATWLWGLYFLENKAQAAQAFLDFKVEIEKQTGFVVKCLNDDKEGGLFSSAFNDKLHESGITRHFTMQAEPNSNGVAEHVMCSIADSATALLYESHLPASCWAKAVATVVYLHSRLPTAANDGKTLFTYVPEET